MTTMLRALIDLLRARGAAPRECLADLLVWARGARSVADVELDLRTAAEIGTIDAVLAWRLLGELDALEGGDDTWAAALAAPELEALAAEVAALAAAQAGLDGRRRQTLELQEEIAKRARQLDQIELRIARLGEEVGAAEARCNERQAQLEGSNDERHQPVLV
jgi:hypothetical protein